MFRFNNEEVQMTAITVKITCEKIKPSYLMNIGDIVRKLFKNTGWLHVVSVRVCEIGIYVCVCERIQF